MSAADKNAWIKILKQDEIGFGVLKSVNEDRYSLRLTKINVQRTASLYKRSNFELKPGLKEYLLCLQKRFRHSKTSSATQLTPGNAQSCFSMSCGNGQSNMRSTSPVLRHMCCTMRWNFLSMVGNSPGRSIILLARIVAPTGVTVDQSKRPFVVVDPRAGHGPGIGGFKADSEIGVALKAGHPCYFIGFLFDPVPGQTIEDIALAEAVFLETVIARHPNTDGKPCVIGNCQAGWAVMILAALRPELFGPIIIAGTPLSYWAGVKGQYPMRYSGGLLGGSWLTALTGDLGAGIFDGAWLVQNFENQNPANTLWTKQYNLYSKVDTEADRYLGFEKLVGRACDAQCRGDAVHRR